MLTRPRSYGKKGRPIIESSMKTIYLQNDTWKWTLISPHLKAPVVPL